MSDKQTILTKASDLLKEWDGKLADLEKQLNEAKDSTQGEINKYIEDLKAKRDELQKKVEEWQGKGEEAFGEIQKEFERLGGEVSRSFNNITEKVKGLFAEKESKSTMN